MRNNSHWIFFETLYFKSKPQIDYLALLVTIAEAFHVILTVGLACEMGERVCGMFSAVDETMDEIDWYLYPIEVQRMLPAIMIVAQKSIYVEFFGSITASRETFQQVSASDCLSLKMIWLNSLIVFNSNFFCIR